MSAKDYELHALRFADECLRKALREARTKGPSSLVTVLDEAELRVVGILEARQDYAGYLRGEHWRWIKSELLGKELYEGRFCNCAVCGAREGIDIHHKTYEHLGDELHHLGDLVPLCRHCHALYHGKLAEEPVA